MKAFKGVDGKIRLFRPYENMKRLNVSAVAASLPVRSHDSHMIITMYYNYYVAVSCYRQQVCIRVICKHIHTCLVEFSSIYML